jgi:hypothetical protein
MYLALVVGILIIALALWMLFMQRHLLTLAMGQVITAMPAQTAPGGVDFPTMEQDHSQPLTTCIRMIMAMVTLMPTLTRIPMLTRMVMITARSLAFIRTDGAVLMHISWIWRAIKDPRSVRC